MRPNASRTRILNMLGVAVLLTPNTDFVCLVPQCKTAATSEHTLSGITLGDLLIDPQAVLTRPISEDQTIQRMARILEGGSYLSTVNGITCTNGVF